MHSVRIILCFSGNSDIAASVWPIPWRKRVSPDAAAWQLQESGLGSLCCELTSVSLLVDYTKSKEASGQFSAEQRSAFLLADSWRKAFLGSKWASLLLYCFCSARVWGCDNAGRPLKRQLWPPRFTKGGHKGAESGHLGHSVHKAMVWLHRPAMTLEVSLRVLKPFLFCFDGGKECEGVFALNRLSC